MDPQEAARQAEQQRRKAIKHQKKIEQKKAQGTYEGDQWREKQQHRSQLARRNNEILQATYIS